MKAQNTNYTPMQRVNIHFYSLLKYGCEPLKGCCEYWQRQDEKTLRDLNEPDAEHLAQIGLTIEDIVRIYSIA